MKKFLLVVLMVVAHVGSHEILSAEKNVLRDLSAHINTEIITPVSHFLKAAKLGLYYLYNANSLGLSYEKALISPSIPKELRELLRELSNYFDIKLLKRVRFLISEEMHPSYTPALASRNLVVLYPNFFDFNRKEQLGILAHELIHVRDHHNYKLIGTSMFLSLSTGIFSYWSGLFHEVYFAKDWTTTLLARLKIQLLSLSIIFPMRLLANHYERTADQEAARALGNTEGLISFFTKVEPAALSVDPTKFNIRDWLETHPTNAARIHYLRQLQRELDLSLK